MYRCRYFYNFYLLGGGRMIIPKAKIEKAVAKNDHRKYINHVFFDKAKSRLVATTGTIVATTPVDACVDDVSGFIPVKALQAARKAGDSMKLNGSVELADGSTFPRPEESGVGKMSDYERVIPDITGDERILNIDVALLYQLAQAMCGKRLEMKIYIPNGEVKAIRVEVQGGGVGAIAPLNRRSTETKK